jgi:hypothetical protein
MKTTEEILEQMLETLKDTQMASTDPKKLCFVMSSDLYHRLHDKKSYKRFKIYHSDLLKMDTAFILSRRDKDRYIKYLNSLT